MNKADFNWSKYIKECLDSTEYFCIATTGASGVWANPVYFSYDETLKFYFISQPHSLHMKNIESSCEIAMAAYNTAQSTHSPVQGMQFKGDAKIIDDLPSAERAYDVYYGRVFPDTRKNSEGKVAKDYLGKSAEWQFVQIIPKEIWYFDNRFFGEGRVRVPDKVALAK